MLPRKGNFSNPICIHCQEAIPWIRYFTLQKCHKCGKSRTYRDWLVQLFLPIANYLLWIFPPNRISYWASVLLLAYFILIAITDIEYRVILHQVSLVGACICFFLGFQIHGIKLTVMGGFAGFVVMLGLYYFGIIFTRLLSKLRNEEISEVALGFGDVNLGGILGLILGWPGIVAGLLLAILIGGVVSCIYILFLNITHRYQPLRTLPYAPFLLLGTAILLYC